jgi:hypothetical protein
MRRFKGLTSLIILIIMVRLSLNKGDVWGESITSAYLMCETFMYLFTGFNFCLDVMRMTYKEFYYLKFKDKSEEWYNSNILKERRDKQIKRIIK